MNHAPRALSLHSRTLVACLLAVALLGACAERNNGEPVPPPPQSSPASPSAPAPMPSTPADPSTPAPEAPAVDKPNIVFILADDLDHGLFDKTPGLKELIADKGTRFENHFVSLSLCCPSRVSILRGQYAHNSGVATNDAPEGGFAKAYSSGIEKSTVATWLQAAGYRTAMIGKYLNGYPGDSAPQSYVPPGWSHWVSPSHGRSYTQYNYTLNVDGKAEEHGRGADDHLNDVITRKATTFIRDSAGKPFFLYLATYLPHTPATPPPRYEGRPPERAPRGASFDEEDVGDKPGWLKATPRLDGAKLDKIDKVYGKRHTSMLAVADLVREVIDALQKSGQLERTYVIFTSDNGFHQGQHRLHSGKNSPYEEDIHVPLVVRGPGVPVGGVVRQLTGNVDFAPTFAELAGASAPDFVDGRSLVTLLRGRTASPWRKVFLIEHGRTDFDDGDADDDETLEPPDDDGPRRGKRGKGKGKGKGKKAAILAAENRDYAGLRTDVPSTYIEYGTGERELYDLAADRDQMNNTYARASAADKARLEAWLAKLRSASGQRLRDAEQAAP